MDIKITLDNLYDCYHEPNISELKDGDIVTWVGYAYELPKNWGQGIAPSKDNNYPRKLVFHDRIFPQELGFSIEEIETFLKEQKEIKFNTGLPGVTWKIMIKNK